MFRVTRRTRRLASRSARVVPGLELLEARPASGVAAVCRDRDGRLNCGRDVAPAILAANQDPDPAPFDVVFNIPASTAPT